MTGIGIAYRNLNQYAEAIEVHQQALAIAIQLNDKGAQAVSYGNLGVSSYFLSRYQQAIEFHQQALALYREIEFREGEGLTLGNLGLVYDDLQNYQQAIDFYRQSLAISRELRDRLREGNGLNNIGGIYLKLEQHLNASNTLSEAIKVYEAHLRSGLADANQISVFDTYDRSYRLLQVALVKQNRFEDALEVAEQSRARAFVEQLAARLERSDPSINSPSLTAIRRIAQQQNSTLVQYSIVRTESDRLLYIWVIKPTGEIHFESVDLTINRSLSELVSSSRDAIGARGRSATIAARPTVDAIARQQAQQRQDLQQLHQLLIEPIARYLPPNENDRVIFIPQGELFLVPFPALINAQGRYLIQDHTILMAPSIQVLDLTRQMQPRRDRDAVLVVGNPVMPEVWNPEIAEREQLSSLPGAEAEAEAIAHLFNTEALLWNQATETEVKRQMQTAAIVHLATHGLLEYGDPQESGVLDAPGAIALAPFAQDDGLLTSAEIYSMNLNADLVVLSACDTGRGRITGDGVVGLSRSLMRAGVPSILVSLWKVPDAPTAELMTEFYRNLRTQPDKAQALRQAMLSVMQQHPDPLNWAAFTLIGQAE